MRVGLVLVGMAGAFLVGRGLGVSDERERLEQELADERRDGAKALQLSEKQGQNVEQLQQLLELTKQRAARVEALREEVELSSAMLLLEARGSLGPLGRLETAERAARIALEPYEGREDETLAPSSREVKGAALDLLGDVLSAKGLVPEAAETRRAALALARVRHDTQPASAIRRHGLARAHEALADALEAGADSSGAWTARQEALKLLKALNDAEPAEKAWLGALADALAKSGATPAGLGRLPEARAHAEEAVALARGLHAKEPQDARWSRTLARALAASAALSGEGAPALALYREALVLLEPPGQGLDPDGVRAAERADTLFALGKAILRAGRVPEAVDELREALDAAVDMVARDPLARAAHERLALVCTALAGALESAGDDEDALRGREEAVRAWRRIGELEPARHEPRHELLRALLAWGDLLTRLKRLDEALAAYHEGRELAGAPGGRVGANPSSGSDLAELYDRSAATLLALGRRAEALAAWREALAAIEPLAKKTPENVFWQADLAGIWWHLGQALLASEPDRAEGTRALKRALRLLAPLEESQRLPEYAATWPASLREQLGEQAAGHDEGQKPER